MRCKYHKNTKYLNTSYFRNIIQYKFNFVVQILHLQQFRSYNARMISP